MVVGDEGEEEEEEEGSRWRMVVGGGVRESFWSCLVLREVSQWVDGWTGSLVGCLVFAT